MTDLLQDYENYFYGLNETELSMNLTMTLKKLDDERFSIKFMTPAGAYSETIKNYGDLYEALGHLFAEENGIVSSLFD